MILCVAVSQNVGVASPPSTGPWYLVGPPFSDNTYIFGKFSNEDTYFGIKGSNWQVTYSTNITMLVERAFDDCSSGGRFVFQAATYDFSMLTLTGGLSPPSNSIVEGEGDATIIDMGTWAYTCFYINTKENVTIRNLRFNREAGTTGYADIRVEDSNNILIKENTMQCSSGSYGSGIKLFGACDNIRIRDNNIHDQDRFGIILVGNTSEVISNVWIVGNDINGVGRNGIHLSARNVTHHIHIADNIITDFGKNTTGSAAVMIQNYAGASALLEDIQICDNQLVSLGNEKASCVGIYLSGDGNATIRDISIHNNRVFGSTNLAWGIGSETSPHGNYFSNLTVTDNEVLSCNSGIVIQDCKTAKISDNWVYGPTTKGIHVYNVNFYTQISDNIVESWGSSGTNPYGIRVSTAANTSITDNVLRANASLTCLNITTNSDNNYVAGNSFLSSGTGVAIKTADCDGTTIKFNDFTSCTTPINDAGTGTVIHYNTGYVTENGGVQVCANNEAIVHGCAATPTMVQVSGGNCTYDAVPVVVNFNYATMDATDFHVCLYWVNGTVITDDVILVSWYVEV